LLDLDLSEQAHNNPALNTYFMKKVKEKVGEKID
jgi:hypothetical protein